MVFQFVNVYPVLTRDPFLKTITDDPLTYGDKESTGAVPSVLPFPLYVTEYIIIIDFVSLSNVLL
jgi:hypothetical protein